MKALIHILVCTVLFIGLVDSVLAQSGSAKTNQSGLLNWKNGDAITGGLVRADDSALYWESDLFRGDLEIDVDFLKSVSFSRQVEDRETDEAYYVRTKSEDVFYGQIEKIDNGVIVLNSKRHGQHSVSLEQVTRIVHLENAGFVMLGPSSLDNWDSFQNKKKYWSLTDSGQLKCSTPDANIFLKKDLPEAVQIEFELKWEGKLDFVFGLGVPRNKSSIESIPRIETWDGSLVLVHPDDFEILYEDMDENLESLKLYVVWDRKNERIFVNDETGKQLCDTKVPIAKKSSAGIYLQNKRGELTVESLRIGKVADDFDPAKCGIHRSDGKVVEGRVVGFDGKSFTVAQEEVTTQVAVERMREAILSPPSSESRSPANILVRFQDGARIRGTLNSIRDGVLSLKPAFSTEKLLCDLSEATHIRFDTPGEIKQTGKQVLYLDKAKIQGQVVGGSGQPGDVLRWLPVGCKSALPLAGGDKRIKFEPSNDAKTVSNWPDTIYFTNRDMIPCRILRIDDQSVHFESFIEKTSVPQKTVKAIDFSPLRAQGMTIEASDDAWYFSEQALKNVETDKQNLTIRGPGHFGHPLLASARSLKFDVAWKQGAYTTLKCKYFARNIEGQTGGISIGFLAFDGGLQVTSGEQSGWGNGRSQVRLAKNSATINIVNNGKSLSVLVNGKKAYSIKLKPGAIGGRGVTFSAQPINANVKTQFTLGNFALSNGSKGASPAIVEQNKKDLLLTIPRIRKSNPSKHILCARNGDLLRGNLSHLDNSHVKFQSRLEEFKFDRDVVSSIVWIHADRLDDVAEESKTEIETTDASSENSPKNVEAWVATDSSLSSETEQIVQVLLAAGQRLTLDIQAWENDTLLGVSKTLGRCEIPVDEILEIRQGAFASKAVDVAYADWIGTHAKAPKMDDGSSAGAAGATESPLLGTRASDFSTVLLDGTQFKLSEHRGKVVVLDFWATWCGPCVKAMPDVISAVGSFQPKDVILVSVNQLEKTDVIKEFVSRRNWDVAVAADSDGSIGERFGVQSIPQTVVIDPGGTITFLKIGGAADLKSTLMKEIRRAKGDANAE